MLSTSVLSIKYDQYNEHQTHLSVPKNLDLIFYNNNDFFFNENYPYNHCLAKVQIERFDKSKISYNFSIIKKTDESELDSQELDKILTQIKDTAKQIYESWRDQKGTHMDLSDSPFELRILYPLSITK